MRILKIFYPVVLLLLIAIKTYSQDSAATHKIDSVTHVIKKDMTTEKQRLSGEIKSALVPPGMGEIKQMINKPSSLIKSSLNSTLQTTPLTKLFEGGKVFTPGQADARIDYNYFRDTSGMALGIFRQMQGSFGYAVNYSLAIESIPFNASIKEENGINTTNYTPFTNFYKFHFDREKYLDLLRKQALAKINPEAVAATINNKITYIRKGYEKGLEKDIAQIETDYTKQSGKSLGLPAGITNLQGGDMSAIRNQLMPLSELQNYRGSMDKYQSLIKQSQPDSFEKDSALKEPSGSIKRYEALQKVYKKIVGWKQKFENNKTVKELKSRLPFSPGQFKSYLSKPSNLMSVLENQADLSPMQKIFSYVKNFDVGQSAVQSGELNMQNVMNTGVNADYQNKKMDMGFIAGKNNTVNNWMQAGLISTISNQYASLAGIKLGSGYGSPVDQSLSINFFNISSGALPPNSPAAIGTGFLPVVAQKTMVFTMHSGFSFSGVHHIVLDVSKSFSAIQSVPLYDSSGVKNNQSNSIFSGSPVQSLAGKLDYTGTILKTDIKLAVKKVGLGYENPGNSFLRKGETEFGMGLARSFLKNKYTIKYDIDYRDQVFDPAKNYSFSTFSNKLQLGAKINKNDRIKLTWQQRNYRSAFYGQPVSYGSNSRMQIDGSYLFLFKGKKIINNTIISLQQMMIPQLTGGNYSNQSIMLMQNSAMQVGKNLLSLAIIGNKSNNSSYYFSTSTFSIEPGYTYTVWGNVHFSSGIGYYANYGWNQQLGIRQQVSTMLNNKLSIDFQLGYRKAIQVTQTALANQLFLNAGTQYHFK